MSRKNGLLWLSHGKFLLFLNSELRPMLWQVSIIHGFEGLMITLQEKVFCKFTLVFL